MKLTVKENSDIPAYPTDRYAGGLTKRELIAAMALQGLMRHPDSVGESSETVAAWAVQAADALLEELDKSS